MKNVEDRGCNGNGMEGSRRSWEVKGRMVGGRNGERKIGEYGECIRN